MEKRLLRRDGWLTKSAAVLFSVILAFGMTPYSAFAQPAEGGETQYTQAEDATVESVETLIAALPEVPTITAAAAGTYDAQVAAAQAAYASLSSTDQAKVDSDTNSAALHGSQSYGRVLESAVWAVAAMQPVDNATTLSDGTYDASSTPALSYTFDKGKTNSGKATWSITSVTVAGGKATATLASSSKSYDYVMVNGTKYAKTNTSGASTFSIPVDLNSEFYFTGHSSAMGTEIAYGMTASIDEPAAPTPTPITDITNKTGMFKVSAAQLETADGQTYLRFTLGGKGYHELFQGTYEEAVANGDGTADKGNNTWIHGATPVTLSAGACEFVMPVQSGKHTYAITAVSNSYYEKYLSGANPLARAFYPRYLTLDTDAPTIESGDYNATSALAATVTGKAPAVTAAALNTVGGPNSNGYQENLALTTDAQAAYVGTASAASAATEGVVAASDGVITFDLIRGDTFGTGGTIPDSLAVAFKLADGTWVDTTVAVSKSAKTVAIAGEEVPDAPAFHNGGAYFFEKTEGAEVSEELPLTGGKAASLSYDRSQFEGSGIAIDLASTKDKVVISGTAGQPGTYAADLTVSNGGGSATLRLTFAVDSKQVTIATESLPAATAGKAYSAKIETTGWTRPMLMVTKGSLPAGLAFTDNGDGTATISGTPTEAGASTITVWASNAVSADATKVFTLTVDEPPTPITDITNKTGMFKVSAAQLETADGQTYLRFTLGGKGYHELFQGTYEEAVANGDGTADKGNNTWIHGATPVTLSAGACEFVMPVQSGKHTYAITAVSNSYYEKYLSGANPLARAFYPRYLTLDTDAPTIESGDYNATSALAATVTGKAPAVTAAALNTVGGPNSNGYQENLALTTDAQAAYVGTASAASAATEGVVAASDGVITFDLIRGDTFGTGGTIPDSLAVAFKLADGTWVDTTVAVSKSAKTVAIAGEEVPDAPAFANGGAFNLEVKEGQEIKGRSLSLKGGTATNLSYDKSLLEGSGVVLALNEDGTKVTMTGTAGTVGTYTVPVTVSNAGGSATLTLTVTVGTALPGGLTYTENGDSPDQAATPSTSSTVRTTANVGTQSVPRAGDRALTTPVAALFIALIAGGTAALIARRYRRPHRR